MLVDDFIADPRYSSLSDEQKRAGLDQAMAADLQGDEQKMERARPQVYELGGITAASQRPELSMEDRENLRKTAISSALPNRNPMSPLTSKRVGRTDEGRPIMRNEDGSVSTERTATFQINGKWYNIPTMYGGKEVSDEQAIKNITDNALMDPETGQHIEGYDSVEQAEAAAVQRSQQLGQKYGKQPWHPGQILDTIGEAGSELIHGMEAAGNLFRGAITGQPGKEVTAGEIFGADNQNYSPAQRTIRGAAGMLVDPFALPLLKAAGSVNKGLKSGAPRLEPTPPQPIPVPDKADQIIARDRILDDAAKKSAAQQDRGSKIIPSGKMIEVPNKQAEPSITELADKSRYSVDNSKAGAYSEGMLTEPMARTPESAAEHGAKQTVQKRVKRYVVDPDSGLVVPLEHTKDGDNAFPLYKEETTGGERPYMSRNRTDAEREFAEKKVPYDQETTVEYEKPGFLRTAEEKIQDTNTNVIRPAEEKILATEPPTKIREKRLIIPASERRSSFDQGKAAEQLSRELEEGWKLHEGPTEINGQKVDFSKHSKKRPVVYGESAPPAWEKKFPYQESKQVMRSLVDETQGKMSAKGQATPPSPVKTDAEGTKPGWFSRIADDAYSVLEKMGDRTARIARLGRQVDSASEQAATRLVVGMDEKFAELWGRKAGLRKFNPFASNSTVNRYNISEDEVRSLVNTLYSGGKVAPINEKVGKMADYYFENGTRLVSNRAGEVGLEIKGPGGFSYPVGQPSMFFSHVPRNFAKKTQMSDMTLRRLYKAQQQKEAGLSFEDFKKRLRMIDDPTEVNAARYRGLEDARTFDASDGGRESAYDMLHRFGYDNDPMRVFTEFAGRGLRRAEVKAAESTFQKELDAMLDAGDEGYEWAKKVVDHITGESTAIADTELSRLAAWTRAFNDATLLQAATIPQFNQLSFVLGHGGLKNMLKGMFTRDKDGIAKNSGANWAAIQHAWSNPDTKVGRWAQSQLYANGFSRQDAWLRNMAAKTGDFYAQDIAKKFAKGDQKQAAFLKELELNPEEILAQGGKLTEDQRLRAAQVFANQTTGRSTLGGVPLWMTSNNEFAKTAMQYKKFFGSNFADLRRQVANAPNWRTGLARLAKTVGAATVFGEITRDLGTALTKLEDPFTEERTAKPLRALGPVAGRLVDDAIAGMGGLIVSGVLTLLSGKEASMKMVLGPTVGAAIDVATDGLKGSTDKVMKAVVRRAPMVGPILPEALGLNESRDGFGKF